jgi:hypothetical protein
MAKREVDAELQVRYYQLSGEHRALILTLAGELVAGKQPPPGKKQTARAAGRPSPPGQRDNAVGDEGK